MLFPTGRYQNASEDVTTFGQSVELEVSQVSLGGLFTVWNVIDTTNVFGQITYEKLNFSASGNGGLPRRMRAASPLKLVFALCLPNHSSLALKLGTSM